MVVGVVVAAVAVPVVVDADVGAPPAGLVICETGLKD